MKSICSLIITIISLLSVHQIKAQAHPSSIDSVFAMYSAPDSNILPVTTAASSMKLSGFSAVVNDNNATLTWTTNTEINSSKFIIEKSADNISWTVFATVPAAGTSNIPVVYYYSDSDLFDTTYYRIKEVDVNAAFEYSAAISISADKDFSIKIFPATVIDKAFIKTKSDVSKNVSIKIYRNNGELVKEVQTKLKAGANSIEITGVNKLRAGMYTAIVYDAANSQAAATRFIKQ